MSTYKTYWHKDIVFGRILTIKSVNKCVNSRFLVVIGYKEELFQKIFNSFYANKATVI